MLCPVEGRRELQEDDPNILTLTVVFWVLCYM